MDPVAFNPVYSRGSPITEEFRFVAENGDAQDMSEYVGFVWQWRKTSAGPLVLQLTLDEDDLATGILRGSATVLQTLALDVQTLQHDLLDGSGVKWFTGRVRITPNISRI